MIFSLTDTWNVRGRPVPWGIEPVMARIREMDLWRDDSWADRMIEQSAQSEERKAHDRRTMTENYLYENHSRLKRAWGDVNTANMEKLYRKDDGTHGYHKSRP